MLIFVYGKDNYQSYQKLKNLQDDFQKKFDPEKTSLITFDLEEEIDLKKIEEEISFFSLFARKKMIVLKNISQNKDFRKKLLSLIEKKRIPKETILVIYEKDEVDMRETFFKILTREKYVYHFDLLKNPELKKWIENEIEKKAGLSADQAKQIEPKALEMLIQFVGNDLWQMKNEIEKLLTHKKIIKEEDVELFVEPKINSTIFNLVEAISKKEKKKSFKLLEDLLEKEDGLYILSMIVWQFRNLLKVKSFFEENRNFQNSSAFSSSRSESRTSPRSESRTSLKLHPFVFEKTKFLARNFSFEELKKIYKKLLDLDRKIKKGEIEKKIGISLFLAEL